MGKKRNANSIKALFPDIHAGDDRLAALPAVIKNSRLFRFLSGWLRRGSLTVEAAICVPLFLMTVAGLICLMNLYGLQARQTVQLQVEAERIAQLENVTGLHKKGIVDLKVPITYQPPLFPFSVGKIKVSCRGRVRAWIGADDQDSGESADDNTRMVYVTDYESVYHTSSECSYLDLQITGVSKGRLKTLRNSYGDKYHACEKCIGKGEEKSVVYVTSKGKAFHNNADCSGLTRHTRMVRESDLDGLRECSRCAAKSSKQGS